MLRAALLPGPHTRSRVVKTACGFALVVFQKPPIQGGDHARSLPVLSHAARANTLHLNLLTASAARPARVYAAPKAVVTLGSQSGMPVS